MARDGGVERCGRQRADPRGSYRRLSPARLLGGDLGPDAGAGQTAAGRAAAPPRLGTDGRILSQPAQLPAMRRATAAEGPASPATALAVRGRDSSCAPFRPLSIQR